MNNRTKGRFLILLLLLGGITGLLLSFSPVYGNPDTFGKTDIGGTEQNGQNALYACKFTLTENANITKLTWYTKRETARNLKTAIYSDNGGVPNALLGTTGVTNVVNVFAWYNFTFAVPLELASGIYWLAMGFDGTGGNLTYYKYDAGAANQMYVVAWTPNGFPNPWVGGGADPRNVSIYATYNIDGGEVASSTPTLVSPWNDTREDVNTNVLFKWKFTDVGTPQGAYEIEIDNNTDFSSPEIDSGKVVSGNNFTVRTIPNTIDKFYWRVRTWNSSDDISLWSSSREFFSDRVNLTLSVSDNRINVNSTLPLVTVGVYASDGTDFVAYQAPTPNCWDINLTLGVDIFEDSGASTAIQLAVDQVAANGNGTVYLPAGTFNFTIELDNLDFLGRETGVIISGGVSIIGHGANETILDESLGVPPAGANMFFVDGRNGFQTRISGIGFVGYVGPDETNSPTALSLLGATDYRVDHCRFTDFTGNGIFMSNNYAPYGANRGLIDHCDFDNPYKGNDGTIAGGAEIEPCLWGYGIGIYGIGSSWDPLLDFLGKYEGTENNVYIEDCTFNRTREAVASSVDPFYVARYSTFLGSIPRNFHQLDVHGSGRGLEAYNNTIIGENYTVGSDTFAGIGVGMRGGGGVIVNNTIIDSIYGIVLNNDMVDEITRIKDLYIWDNSMEKQDMPAEDPTTFLNIVDPLEIREDIEYFLYKRLGYTPYPYPHPYSQGYVGLNDTRHQTIAGRYGYSASYIVDWNYNLTVFDSTNEVYCIFDQQNLTASSANNTTPEENEGVLLSVRFFSTYDNHELNGTDGDILTLGDDQEPMNYYDFTYNGTDWNCETSWASNGTYEIDKVVFLEEKTYGITLGSMAGESIIIEVGETSGNEPPYAPTLDSPSNSTRYDLGESVTFTWTFSDPNGSDTQGAYQIQLDNDDQFGSAEVDSGKVVSSTEQTDQNLPSSVDTYYWRVKTWDNSDAEGPWSQVRYVVADRVRVKHIVANDTRVDVDSYSELTVGLEFESDSTDITSGSFSLEGNALAYQSGGNWTRDETRATVMDFVFDNVAGSVGNVEGVNMNGKSKIVIWDRYEVTVLGCNDSSPYLGNASKIHCLVESEYDSHELAGGDTLSLELSNGTAVPMSHNGSYWTATLVSQTPVTVTVNDYNTLYEASYGISVLKTDFSLGIQWVSEQGGNPDGEDEFNPGVSKAIWRAFAVTGTVLTVMSISMVMAALNGSLDAQIVVDIIKVSVLVGLCISIFVYII